MEAFVGVFGETFFTTVETDVVSSALVRHGGGRVGYLHPHSAHHVGGVFRIAHKLAPRSVDEIDSDAEDYEDDVQECRVFPFEPHRHDL